MANVVGLLEIGLYSALSTYGDLITELGGTAIYNKLAPQGASLPYAIFQWQGGGDENMTKNRTRNLIYTVKGVATTNSKAASIDGDIDAALTGKRLTVTGWANFWTAREGDVNFVETNDAGEPIYHVGGQYRFRTEDV